MSIHSANSSMNKDFRKCEKLQLIIARKDIFVNFPALFAFQKICEIRKYDDNGRKIQDVSASG
ncbi:MAG TPA: hypothetical protein DCR17_01520 [Verrucomicrobiales bacterium]|nr:hypothetical protein [Pedosphaera sp.]HAO65354.1 hypothetical protein [Verrucomicrobiales bacterium]HAQ97938.1 hypothetical protein [Verrucomicrobiales bacterium]HAW00681.1 hypothetical protein [Verrucomicrobiales bacterium]HBP55132.1 hypothetical protein [Verrucomicrobiales bacterium]